MKKNYIIIVFFVLFSLGTSACSDETPSGNTEKPELPVNPEPPLPSETLKGSFESKFVRYAKGQKFIGQEDDRLVTRYGKTPYGRMSACISRLCFGRNQNDMMT